MIEQTNAQGVIDGDPAALRDDMHAGGQSSLAHARLWRVFLVKKLRRWTGQTEAPTVLRWERSGESRRRVHLEEEEDDAGASHRPRLRCTSHRRAVVPAAPPLADRPRPFRHQVACGIRGWWLMAAPWWLVTLDYITILGYLAPRRNQPALNRREPGRGSTKCIRTSSLQSE